MDYYNLIIKNHISAFKELLASGWDVREHGGEAIRLSSLHGKYDIVQLLLDDPRVDPSVLDNYALEWAIMGKHINVIKLLITDKRVRDKVNSKIISAYPDIINLLRPYKIEALNL